MNGADLAIIVVIVLSVLIGLVRGLVVEVMSLVVWIAAVVLARLFGAAVAQLFSVSIEIPSARLALGYAIVFVATLLLGAVLVWLLRKMVQGTGLTGTDRMLGMLFGLVRGGVIVVLAVLLFGFTPFPRDPWWRESRALPVFVPIAQQLASHLPEAMAKSLDYSPVAAAPPTPKKG